MLYVKRRAESKLKLKGVMKFKSTAGLKRLKIGK